MKPKINTMLILLTALFLVASLSSLALASSNGEVHLQGTEYTVGQNAKLWLQLLNATGSSVTDGVCFVDIYTPSGGIYIERATMTNMIRDGVYYYDLIAPVEQGVYLAIATCDYTAIQVLNYASAYSLPWGVYVFGSLANTQVIDGIVMRTRETNIGGVRRIDERLNFSSTMCKNVSEDLLTGISISFTARFDSVPNDDLTVSVWNYSSSSWINLTNKILEGPSMLTSANQINFHNITTAGLISGTNPLQLRVIDTPLPDGADSNFDVDQVYVSCDQLSNPQWQEVKGSSEMHVTSEFPYTPFTETFISQFNVSYNGINSSYYTGLFIANFTIASGTSITLDNETIEYSAFHSLPCNSVEKLYRIESNGSLTDIPFFTKWHTQEGHCSINFEQTLEVGENYQYLSYARNTWGSDLRSSKAGNDAIYPLLSAGCDLWAIQHNETPYPYTIPKNQTSNNSDFYIACSDYYDDYYWFNLTFWEGYYDRLNLTNEEDFLEYESDYYSNVFAENKLNTLTTLLLNDIVTSGVYSQLVMANSLNRSNMAGNRFFANVSTPQENYYLLLRLNSTAVNDTQIASAVWNYSGEPASNLLNSIASAVWNYIGRYVHGTISS